MILGAVTLIVGLFVSLASLYVTIIILGVGLGIYVIASALAVLRAVLVLVSKINHRSPEYRRAIDNTVIMSVVFALAVFGLVYIILF